MRYGLGARSHWAALLAGVIVFGAVETLVLHLIAGALLPDVGA
jgi:hypothetical protein